MPRLLAFGLSFSGETKAKFGLSVFREMSEGDSQHHEGTHDCFNMLLRSWRRKMIAISNDPSCKKIREVTLVSEACHFRTP